MTDYFKESNKWAFFTFGIQFCALGLCVALVYVTYAGDIGSAIGIGIGSSTGLFFACGGPMSCAIGKIKYALTQSAVSGDKFEDAMVKMAKAQTYIFCGCTLSFLSMCLAGVVTGLLCDRPFDLWTGPVSTCDGKAAGLGFFSGTGPFFSGLIATMNGLTIMKTALLDALGENPGASTASTTAEWPPRNEGCSGGSDGFLCCRACCCPCFVISEIAKKEDFEGADKICLRTGIWWAIVWIFGPAWWWFPTIGQNVGWYFTGQEPWVVFCPHAFCAIWQTLYVGTIMQQHNRIADKYGLTPIQGGWLGLMFWVIFASWGLTLIQQYKVVGLAKRYEAISTGPLTGAAVEVIGVKKDLLN